MLAKLLPVLSLFLVSLCTREKVPDIEISTCKANKIEKDPLQFERTLQTLYIV